jgi:hypothetical protein
VDNHCSPYFKFTRIKRTFPCPYFTIGKFYVLLTVHLDLVGKTKLMHGSSSVYCVKHLYMFGACLKPIIRRYTVWIKQLVLIVLLRWLLLSCQDNSHLNRKISTNCCIHMVYLLMMDFRYARNMYRFLTKYTEDELCIKLVFLSINLWLELNWELHTAKSNIFYFIHFTVISIVKKM